MQITEPLSKRVGEALDDVLSGSRMVHAWGLLGLHDIKQRYRRSTLGPFWLTISTGIMVGTMGLLYAKLLGQELSNYLPYLAVGLVLWNFISATINDLCIAFISAENLVKQVRLPLTVHVLRVVWRNMLILAHNAIILLIVALTYSNTNLVALLVALAGVAVLGVTAVAGGLILGALCARFRDIPPLVTSLVQLVFFMSPILWRPEVLGNRMWMATVNPVYHYIEIVRAPVIAGAIPLTSWGVCLLGMFISVLAAFLLLMKYRARVPYWV